MSGLSRVDSSSFARWWRNLDRVTLACVGMLIGLGYVLMLAASPAVASRIGASRNMFILKQVIFLSIAGLIVLGTSYLSRQAIRRLALIGGIIALGATAMTLVHGMEIKGARRWIALPLMSVQPSEFLKPCFAVVTGWLLSARRSLVIWGNVAFPGMLVAFICFGIILFLLKSQPDIGMLSVITMVFFTQLFVDGLRIYWVGLCAAAMAGAFAIAYIVFPHVQSAFSAFFTLMSAIITKLTPRFAPSVMAACSAGGPARGASRICYQMPMRISSSQ